MAHPPYRPPGECPHNGLSISFFLGDQGYLPQKGLGCVCRVWSVARVADVWKVPSQGQGRDEGLSAAEGGGRAARALCGEGLRETSLCPGWATRRGSGSERVMSGLFWGNRGRQLCVPRCFLAPCRCESFGAVTEARSPWQNYTGRVLG